VRDIDILERVQRLFTRRLPGFQGLRYEDRLEKIGLASLQDRRIKKDLLMVFKILKGFVELNKDDFFQLSTAVSTRGHSLKLAVPQCNLEVRRNFFSHRVIKYWNALPSFVVNALSPEIFKVRVSQYVFSDNVGGRIYVAVRSARSVPPLA
jgi:hypothetical protein